MSNRPHFLRPGPFDSLINWINTIFTSASTPAATSETTVKETPAFTAPTDLAAREPKNPYN